uniref:Uncharacterized protein n=1 Tax=Anguilla anguilla TaxID=7936 RepID=A0A0E9V1W2_ANGAN
MHWVKKSMSYFHLAYHESKKKGICQIL